MVVMKFIIESGGGGGLASFIERGKVKSERENERLEGRKGREGKAVPLFLSEIAPTTIRGGLNLLFQLNVTIGILFATLVNYGAAKLDDGRAALKRIRGTKNVEAEFLEILEASRAAKEIKHPFRNILKWKNRPPRVIAIAMQAIDLSNSLSYGLAIVVMCTFASAFACFSNNSTQSCLGAYALINFTQDTQKKYFDPIRRGRVKKLGQKGRVQESRMCLGTWNIGTLTGKSMEVVEVMVRRMINIMCLQETKWVGLKAKDLENSGFKLWYSSTNRMRNGVGIIVDKTLTQDVVDVKRVGDRIMAIKIVIGQELINVISAYAPQVGLDTSSKEKFWEDLGDLVQGIAQTEKLFIGGDLNGHVGRETDNYGGFHSGHGFGEINEDGEAILDFAMTYDLFLANTFFKKREEHVITYKSGSSKTQIDFLLMRKRDHITC
ncbi:uncharacterized protein LOC126609148, partial [Malus sylvestris]|uniref:uncharacterized protein LOC126609148 n=1 Tax=Malus sylvestris TaxID=3752 RepID=UPI0021AC95B0